jgi:hypothetical protein
MTICSIWQTGAAFLQAWRPCAGASGCYTILIRHRLTVPADRTAARLSRRAKLSS